jgi:hypothetical protein
MADDPQLMENLMQMKAGLLSDDTARQLESTRRLRGLLGNLRF